MTFGAQVVHIMRKDIRQSAWELGITSALLVVAAFLASRWIPNRGSSDPWLPYALWLAGFFTCAGVLHNDPPTLLNRFWASKPIDAMALLGAKLIIVVSVMLALPLGAQTIALSMLGTPMHDIPAFLQYSFSIVLPVIPALLLTGALTDDLKSFVMVWIGMGVSVVLVSMFAGTEIAGVAIMLAPFRQIIPLACCVVLFAVLVVCYRARDFDRRFLLVPLVIAYWSLFVWYSDAMDRVSRSEGTRVFSSMPHGTLEIDSTRVEIGADSSRELHVYLNAGDTTKARRIALSTITMTLDTGGPTFHDGFADDVAWYQSATSPAITRDVRIANASAVAVRTFALRLLPGTGALLDRADAHVQLNAIATEYQPESWTTLDLRRGAKSFGPMQAYAFVGLGSDKQTVNLEFLQSALGLPTPHAIGPDPEWYEYFLVNDSVHSATALTVEGSWTQTRSVVLPGESINTRALHATVALPVAASKAFNRGSSITSSSLQELSRPVFVTRESRSDPRLQELPYLRGHLLAVRWTKRSQRAVTLTLPGK